MRLIAAGFLLGIVATLSLPILPPLAVTLVFPLLILLIIVVPRLRFVWAFFAGFAWTIMQANLVLTPHLDQSLEGIDLQVEAKIAAVPEQFEKKIRFLVAPQKLLEPVSDYALPDLIRVNWYHNEQSPKVGELWRMTLRLKQPHGFANPGGFDYEKWLFGRGIRAVGYVRDSSVARKLEDSGYSVNRFRGELSERLSDELKGFKSSGLIQALALGLRGGLDKNDWDVLIKSGTNHLVAISGLHIGLIAGMMFWLVNLLWRVIPGLCLLLPAQKVAAAMSIVPAVGYAILAGFSVPTQRALIMLLVVVISLLLSSPVRRSTILAVALCAVLLFDSLAILSPGFWLSFAAVGAILWSINHASPSRFPKAVTLQFKLILALMPLTLWFFAQSSLIAPLANLVAVPVVALIAAPVLLLGLMVLHVYEPLGWILIMMVEKILSALMVFLEFLTHLPLAHWHRAIPEFALFAVVSAGILLLLSFRGLPGRWLGLIWLLPLFFVTAEPMRKGEFEVTVMDVGQGLSTIVRTDKYSLVYDTGARFSDRFNAADAVLLPYLLRTGIGHIDTLVLSHADNDHAGSVEALNRGIEVKQTLTSFLPDQLSADQWSYCDAGQQWEWDGVTFKVLHPERDWIGVENDRSCVLSIESPSGKALLTGDIGIKAEKKLIAEYPDELHSELLVVPHHGSLTSSSVSFIQSVTPEFAVFPVGYRNRWGFPKQKVVARYLNQDTTLFRTDESGAIRFRFMESGEITVNEFRKNHVNFWTSR